MQALNDGERTAAGARDIPETVEVAEERRSRLARPGEVRCRGGRPAGKRRRRGRDDWRCGRGGVDHPCVAGRGAGLVVAVVLRLHLKRMAPLREHARRIGGRCGARRERACVELALVRHPGRRRRERERERRLVRRVRGLRDDRRRRRSRCSERNACDCQRDHGDREGTQQGQEPRPDPPCCPRAGHEPTAR